MSKKIEQRAYEIWEAEGRPEGRDQEHWLRAEAELNAKPKKPAAAKAAPKKAEAKKAAPKKAEAKKAAGKPAAAKKPAAKKVLEKA